MKYLKDKVIWITGASSGIGRALATQAAAEGAKLIVSARRHDVLEELIQSLPTDCLVLPLDLLHPEGFAGAVATAIAHFGHIDVLVNNAGISQRSLIKDTQTDVDQQLIKVNYLGTVALTKAVLPEMLMRQIGHIVVVSSVAGKIGTPMRSSYSASKFALHGFFDALRAELAPDHIQVTLVCPGYIKTSISINALTANGTAQGTMDAAQANGLSAYYCAEKIWQAVAKGKHEILIAQQRERLAVLLQRFFPSLMNRIIRNAKVT